VIAANNDGVWNTTGSTLAFDIPPTFVQSKLFFALCMVLALAFAWLLYSLRLRQMAGRIRGRLEERLAERERIARELHDTLLQGFQGLLLRFQAVADEMPVEHPTHGKMEKALERAEDVLVEGRDRVRDLRTTQTGGELSRMLADAADRLELDPQIAVRVIVEGTPRDLHPAVCDEIVAIGKEALFNISCHAKAKAIEICIRHDRRQLEVKFIDDGVGIDEVRCWRGGARGISG
jgi:signal transduction histidine kinase